MDLSDLAQNLRLLCAREKSVSEICREIGINRQQFGKYLSGRSRPSQNNMHRICQHFGVQVSDLLLPSEDFAGRLEFLTGMRPSAQSGALRLVRRAFPGDRRGLSRYLGYYLSHFYSFSWDGYVLRSLVCIYERDGVICCRTVERCRDPTEGTLYRSRYDGYVSLLGNRLFVVEFESLAEDAIVETILQPAGRSHLTLLRGVTFGVSSRMRRPYVSRTAWKYIGKAIDHRAVLRSIGLVPKASHLLEPAIIRTIGEQPFPNDLLHYDTQDSRKS